MGDPSWEKLSSPNEIACVPRAPQWCSTRDVEPIAVDDDVVATYREVLTRKTFVKNAAKSVQNLIRSWNRCRKSVDGWPRVELTVIIRREIYLLPVETFPEPFAADLNAWCDRLGGTDLLDEQEFPPLRDVSVVWNRNHALRCASALTRQGVDPSDIVDLSLLVEIENAKNILRWFLARNENSKPSQQTHQMSGVLMSIARHWVRLDEGSLQTLNAVCSRCRVKFGGMTKKNRDMLRLFDDGVWYAICWRCQIV